MGLKMDLVREIMHDICANAAPHEIEEIITDLIAIRDTKLLEMRLGIDLGQVKEEIANKVIQKYSDSNVEQRGTRSRE